MTWVLTQLHKIAFKLEPTYRSRSLVAHTAKGVTTRTAVNSHLCVMIGAPVALSQSQHIGVSHYLLVRLRPKCRRAIIQWKSQEVNEIHGSMQLVGPIWLLNKHKTFHLANEQDIDMNSQELQRKPLPP